MVQPSLMICDLQWAMINDLSEPYLALRTCSRLVLFLQPRNKFVKLEYFLQLKKFKRKNKALMTHVRYIAWNPQAMLCSKLLDFMMPHGGYFIFQSMISCFRYILFIYIYYRDGSLSINPIPPTWFPTLMAKAGLTYNMLWF